MKELNFQNQIIIRVDGNSIIGLGHLTRCIAFAHMLKDHFSSFFIFKEIPDVLLSEMDSIGFYYIKITHESEFLDQLNETNIVVLDGYQFNTDYQRKIKNKGSKLVCIDDLHDQQFYADTIINHAPGITPQNYKAQSYTKYALGLEFVLLRPLFLRQASKKRVVKIYKTILICFGGSDFKSLTQKVLRIVLEFTEFRKIIVVTGAAFVVSEEFKDLISSNRRIDHRHSLAEEQMVIAMSEAEIAIVPASGILFEAIASGCQVVTGTYAENQLLVYRNFLLSNLVVPAGNFELDETRKAIKKALKSSPPNKQIIDGNSPKRLISLISELKFRLRTVKAEDCRLLYIWVNDNEVRQNSISKGKISWDNHKKWFRATIISKNSKIFILELDGRPVGQVRYELQDSEWIIDYSVESQMRGKGLGKICIKLSMEYFKGQKLKAIVNVANAPSKNIFISLDFRVAGIIKINNELYLEYKKIV
jgi:UDP-2,4-diacetamido-2,4,6-trideoxy-beta-L-altropyranose hydrolase